MACLRFCLILGLLVWNGAAATLSTLAARGYAVLPEPQRVTLGPSDFSFGPAWSLALQGLPQDDVAVADLTEGLASRFHLQPPRAGTSGTGVRLVIAPGSVAIGEALDADKQAIAEQAYKMELSSAGVTVTANAPAGLFYGVQTLLQLVTPRGGGLRLPQGEIVDWPDLRLRQIYWDDAHHLDRPDTLRQTIRQAAFFKLNGVVIKLEGHFQYRSAPAVVEPYALSPGELQSLTDYALRRHVQLIPYLDGPAHIAFILKHPEYVKLRAFPDNNYELCVTNPDSYKLLFGMYQDLLDATRGSRYFYLSTDEAYYVGLANNSQCNEAARTKELGSVGKVLAEFVTRTANWLHDHGRTVVFWGEYPLKPSDIPSLPSHLVNGEVYGPQFDPLYRKHGIRQTIYTSTQGEERHFPEYFPLPPEKRLHAGRSPAPRVQTIFEKISFDPARRMADLFGAINAGWADSGLHPETFWLGYAAGTAAAWHPGSPDPRESMSAFYRQFYGGRTVEMDRAYRLMSWQAQFWTDSWETGPSKARKPIWGNSEGAFHPKRPATDQFLPLPPAPAEGLAYRSAWSKDNTRRLELAAEFTVQNDELIGLLHENLQRADFNRYNLEVYLSVARLCRQNLEMLADLGRMDSLLSAAAAAAAKNQTRRAVGAADQALEIASGIRRQRNAVLRDLTETWYKSWYPRVAAANGREFLHELDDVKDHRADRTVDLSYLVLREILLPFGEWVDQIRTARNRYAEAHNLPPNRGTLRWKDLGDAE